MNNGDRQMTTRELRIYKIRWMLEGMYRHGHSGLEAELALILTQTCEQYETEFQRKKNARLAELRG
jgi:hypothetical protein